MSWEAGVRAMVRNGGLARRDELLALGVGERTMRRRVSAGLLVPVNQAVVALPGTDLDLPTTTRAAVMARPDAIPTGLSAASLLGSGPWDDVPQEGPPWLVGRNDRVLQARFLSHPGIQTVRREGMAIAHPAAAVIDLLRFLERRLAADVGRRALQQRVVTIATLVAGQAQLAGRHGVAQLAALIAEIAEGTHSDAEHELVAALRRAGLTGWHTNHLVRVGARRYFVDVAFPEAGLAIEVDGRAYHSDARAFQRDRRRQNDLVSAGWTVLRFTWDDIIHRPDEVIARIVAALRRALLR